MGHVRQPQAVTKPDGTLSLHKDTEGKLFFFLFKPCPAIASGLSALHVGLAGGA